MDISAVNSAITSGLQSTPPAPPAPDVAERRELVRAINAINAAALFGHDTELTFQLDRRTQRAVARIVKRDTGEVIRQIPSESVLRLAEDLSVR